MYIDVFYLPAVQQKTRIRVHFLLRQDEMEQCMKDYL